ncbi:MAG: Hsp20/alpha crystallin family protein [Dehalococcoidia bacterium]|nr:MAG: Hsp20/alpha crystallin family protein [Dehalococcoidia bacterium]
MSDLVIRDSFVPNGFRTAFDRFFDEPFFRGFPAFPAIATFNAAEAALPVDIVERDGALVVEASLPGYQKGDIDVQVHDGVLTIKAEKKQETEEKTEQFYRRERSFGSVSRRINLPTEVNEAAVDAELKNGVLTLRLPLPEQRGPKSVEIRGE